MNIRDLRYILAVAEYGHFGQAAAHCYVSQPTLSMQIKKLEDELGIALFERHPKKVRINPAAEPILAQAQAILTAIDELKSLAQQAQDPLSGEVRLGIIPTVAPYLLGRISASLQKKMPKLKLKIHEDKTENIISQLRKGQLDGIILALPITGIKDLAQQTLYEEKFKIALSKNNPLAKKKYLSLKEIIQQPLLLLAEGHCLRDQALSLCQTQQNIAHDFQATSLETLSQIVAASDNITLFPELATLKNTNAHLVFRNFNPPSPKRTIALLWRNSNPRKKIFHYLATAITEIVEK